MRADATSPVAWLASSKSRGRQNDNGIGRQASEFEIYSDEDNIKKFGRRYFGVWNLGADCQQDTFL